MPFVNLENTRIFYRFEGADARPVLVLSHSLGVDHGMWDPQMPALLNHFRVLRYDTRGHGASDVPSGEYTLERLGRDVVGLLDALAIENAAFCGLSMGGMIGQWLGAHAAERCTHLVLANTSPRTGPEGMEARRKAVLEAGMSSVEPTVMGRFFSPETATRAPARYDSTRRTLLATNPAGYAGCCAAIRDMDNRPALQQIKTPTLIIAGDRDVSTPWDGHGEILAREIPHAKVVRFPTAHLSNLERPHSFSAALLDFLLPASSADRLETGFTSRRAVLGDDHVDRAIASTSDFTREFQELITRYAWGTVWSRPGLDHCTRRLLALTAIAALGHWEEFRMHVRTGLAHELEPANLKEALLQLAIYAGVPVANHAFRIAAEELA